MPTLKKGDRGRAVERFQEVINHRLHARSAPAHMIKEDGDFGPKTLEAACYAFYLCGADRMTIDGIKKHGVSSDEQHWLAHPGKRTKVQRETGEKRVAKHRAVVKKQEAESKKASDRRQRIVREAKQAAANYRKNPGAYHYLAGGVANLIYLRPSPSNYRSDCSQFAASVFKGAGLPSPASVSHEWASTFTMVKAPEVKFVDRAHRKPGMLGMYGSRSAPHHVEIYIGEEVAFIGHGSPPIDSLTPGEPDYYLDFPFLN